jgi:3-dehydroquinate synthase
MRALNQSLSVAIRYSVHFTEDLFAPDNLRLRKVVGHGRRHLNRLLCVVDRGACTHRADLPARIQNYCVRHRDVLDLVCAPILVPGGERVKSTPTYVARIQEAVHRHGLCRHSYILAIGGGAVLDMTGFAAATAHRGIRLVRIPTTVLSQNDVAVGVKNSVNAFNKKNFLGTFAPPYAVVNDSTFLETLSDRDWRAGTSEAVKVSLVRDPVFFRFLEHNAQAIAGRSMNAMAYLIRRCAQLHMEHMAEGNDPFETGSSRPLDFGHWAAHKLEQLTRFRLRHGEAVAIGVALDSTYSMRIGLLSETDWRRILGLLSQLGFQLRVPRRFQRLHGRDNPDSLEHGLTEFREHLGGELTILLLKGIGSGIEVHQIDDRILAESIAILDRAQ